MAETRIAVRQPGDHVRLNNALRFIARCTWFALIAIAMTPPMVRAQPTIPRAVMTKLSHQLRKDVPAMRDCTSKSAFPFSARTVDLNGDGGAEYLLTSASDCECGQANCSQWVYRAQGDTMQLLLEAEGYVLSIDSASHNGWRDIRTTSRNNAAIVDHIRYAFTGTRYERADGSFENLETHQSKPSLQRVRFSAGQSSTTVSGTTAPSFPDTWVLSARQGQTLQLVLTGARKAGATFTVMGPDAGGTRMLVDSQSQWSGQLPSSGTYTIIVDGIGDARTAYRLKIAIP